MIKAYLHFKLRSFNWIVKQTFFFAGIILATYSYCYAQEDSISQVVFAGTWKVARLIEVEEGEPGPEGTETSYPDTLTIIFKNKQLSAKYTDQFGRTGSFNTILNNGGNDLILAYSHLTTKDPTSFAILHHLKIWGDTLQGVTFGRTRLFEWRAVKFKYKTPDSRKKK